MKPHIKMIDKIWYCCGGGQLGLGFTPFLAYDEWLFLALDAI